MPRSCRATGRGPQSFNHPGKSFRVNLNRDFGTDLPLQPDVSFFPDREMFGLHTVTVLWFPRHGPNCRRLAAAFLFCVRGAPSAWQPMWTILLSRR